jgi:hypothetical protein
MTFAPSQPISPLADSPHAWPHAEAPAPRYDVPLTVGGILDRTFRFFGADVGRQGLLWALPYGGLVAGLILFIGVGFALGIDTASTTTQVGFGLAALVACGVLMGVTFGVMAGSYVGYDEVATGEGKRPLGSLIAAGWPLWPRVLGVGVVLGAATAVFVAPGMGMFAASGAELVAPEVGLAAGFLLLMPGLLGALFMWVRLSPASVIAAVEEKGTVASLAQAWSMTRGHGRTLLGITIVWGLLLAAVSMPFQIIGMIPVLGWIVQLIGGVLQMAANSAFAFAVYAALKDQER